MKKLRTPSLPSRSASVPTPRRALCMQKGICCLLCASGCSSCSTLRTDGLQTAKLLSMGFPRQEYWSGLPFPPRGDLLDPGIEPNLLGRRFFTIEPATWEVIFPITSVRLKKIHQTNIYLMSSVEENTEKYKEYNYSDPWSLAHLTQYC